MTHSADEFSTDSSERLQKVLAAAGIASRRECEELIAEGRVEVDGVVVTELGVKVDPESQDIRLDGERVKAARKQYLAFYKPVGVLCTSADPEGRLSVVDLIPTSTRVFTVGRLDKSSEGLIVVTNDGPLAQRLTHPSFGIEKTYEAIVAGQPTWESVRVLLDGVRLADGWAKVKHIEIRRRVKGTTQLRIVLDEGRNREIRRLLARIGHKVLRLKRTAIGKLTLGTLTSGESRKISADELKLLEMESGYVKRRAALPDSDSDSGAPRRPRTVARPRTGFVQRPRRNEDAPPRPRSNSARPIDRPARGGTGRPDSGRPDSGRERVMRERPMQDRDPAARPMRRPMRDENQAGGERPRSARPAYRNSGEDRGEFQRPAGRPPRANDRPGPGRDAGPRRPSGPGRPGNFAPSFGSGRPAPGSRPGRPAAPGRRPFRSEEGSFDGPPRGQRRSDAPRAFREGDGPPNRRPAPQGRSGPPMRRAPEGRSMRPPRGNDMDSRPMPPRRPGPPRDPSALPDSAPPRRRGKALSGKVRRSPGDGSAPSSEGRPMRPGTGRPSFRGSNVDRPRPQRSGEREFRDDRPPRRRPEGDSRPRPAGPGRPGMSRPGAMRPNSGRPGMNRPSAPRPGASGQGGDRGRRPDVRPGAPRPNNDRPRRPAGPSANRPPVRRPPNRSFGPADLPEGD